MGREYKESSRRWHTCGRKKRYRREHDASLAARRIMQSAGVNMEWYECQYCKGWHLTSERYEAEVNED